jgi:plasmid replication initiation protein
MTKKQMVSKDNDLIGANYSLGVAEQRLIFLAIIEAREQNKLIDVGKPLRIYAKSYEQQFSVEKHTSYEAMKRAVNGLYEAGFSYIKIDEASGKPITYKSRWVEKIGYADDLGCVELTFASDVIPLITRLDSCYTEYDLKQVSSLQSEYAIRLYELMMQWKKVGKVPTIDLQDLRNKLGVKPDQYKDMNNFKGRVLDHAIKQINDFTDITADYEQHKTGRTITAMSFTFKVKKAPEPITSDDTFIKMTDDQIDTFSKKLAALPEVGSNFAPSGMSKADFVAIIADHLADENKQARYIPYLSKVGYKQPKHKKQG